MPTAYGTALLGRHELAIRGEIEQQTSRKVNSGAVYITLERLENRGLVSSSCLLFGCSFFFRRNLRCSFCLCFRPIDQFVPHIDH